MNTSSAWDSSLLAKVLKITPPSIANSCEFWNLGYVYSVILLSRFLVSFTDRLAYSVVQINLI